MPPVRAIQHRSMRAHPLPYSACTHSSKQAAIQNAALQTRRDARIDTTAASFVHRSKLCTAGRRIPVALTPTSINSTALRAVRAPLGLGGLRVAAERANMDPAQQAQLSARALQRDGRRGKRRQCRGAASAGSAGARTHHLVALHFSPRVVGQLPCRLLWSTSPLGVRLRSRAAHPRWHTRLATPAALSSPPADGTDRRAHGLPARAATRAVTAGAPRRSAGAHL